MIREAVFDTGPLIHLEEVEAGKALQLFKTVLITEEVEEELGETRAGDFKVMGLQADSKDWARYLVDRKDLDLGEASAIALCRQEGVGYFFTDDLEARKAAEEIEIEAHGTLGIITRAYRENILSEKEAKDKVRQLHKDSSLFITKDVVDWAVDKIEDHEDNR